MKAFIAMETGKSVKDVEAFVLGGHGDTMVPMMSHAKVGITPLSDLLSQEKIDVIVERTKNGGAEIVQYLKTGSAYFAPAASIMDMVESILKDQKRVLPCATYLSGEYGYSDIFIGVPAVLGAHGIEKVIEMELTEEERTLFNRTAEHVKELVEKLLSGEI